MLAAPRNTVQAVDRAADKAAGNPGRVVVQAGIEVVRIAVAGVAGNRVAEGAAQPGTLVAPGVPGVPGVLEVPGLPRAVHRNWGNWRPNPWLQFHS